MNRIDVEPRAAKVIAALQAAGHRAYVVGGCVRDALLGRVPGDWDACTSATPEQVMALFGEARCIPTGLRHGTVTVRCEGLNIEVTTFRTEGAYSDGRHPDNVVFVSDVREDLARRDFTVNAMAYCDAEGLIDPFGGLRDLESGVLRAVGVARERFTEDALRILRLFRFGAKLGFALEEETRRAALALRENLFRVSVERVFGELSKLLVCQSPGAYLPQELLRVCLPEVAMGDAQTYARRLCVVDAVPARLEVRLAALFGDVNEDATRAALMRLHASNALTDAVSLLVRERELGQEADAKALRIQARRCLGRMSVEDLKGMKALRDARIAAGEHLGELDDLLEQAKAFESGGACCRVAQLAVNGSDLREALGISGPAVGRMLAWLLERVICEEIANEREALLAAARTCGNG